MSKSPFISKNRSFEILVAAVFATIPEGDYEDGRRARWDAFQWVDLIDDLKAETLSLEEFRNQVENLPWLDHAAHEALWAFIEYETQREIWGRYQARQALQRAAHRAETTNLGSLLKGAVRMARESRHAA